MFFNGSSLLERTLGAVRAPGYFTSPPGRTLKLLPAPTRRNGFKRCLFGEVGGIVRVLEGFLMFFFFFGGGQVKTGLVFFFF